MKKFKDLEFVKFENNSCFDQKAVMQFNNGFGVVVVSGFDAEATEKEPFEVNLLLNNKHVKCLSIDKLKVSPHNKRGVSLIMKKIQKL